MNSAMPRSMGSKLRNRFAREIRSTILRSRDFPIEFTYSGAKLLAPFSHELPMISARYPKNSVNFGAVVERTAETSVSLLVVDVGANIGDSTVLGRSLPNVRYLCIEGSEDFIPYLRRNVGSRGDVQIVPAIIGQVGELLSIQSGRGTGNAIVGQAGSIPVRSLASVVSECKWSDIDKILLKIDTDGFDAQILVQSSEFIAAHKPDIFFEYDPIMADQSHTPTIAAIEMLLRIGYSSFEVWDKYGSRLLGTSKVNAGGIFSDLTRFCRESSSNYVNETMYFDVWASY
jgi:FkbM family methyltransferase